MGGVQLAHPYTALKVGMKMWAGDTKLGVSDTGGGQPKPWAWMDEVARRPG